MIKPDDIRVETRDNYDHRATQVLAVIHATVSRYLPIGHEVALLHLESERCKLELWHGLYGDIERALQEMRQKVLYDVCTAAGPVCSHSAIEHAGKAIDDVLAMVRNPF
jgi:hypothetical protein